MPAGKYTHKRTPIAVRFWRKVGPLRPDGCRYWTGCTQSPGYGRIGLPGRTGTTYAHKVAYELAKGPIPDGMLVRHTCDVPQCVNPDHLVLGTDADNHRDMYDRGRAAVGEKNGCAKLTAEQVREIRVRRAKGEGVCVLSRAFGVSHSTVSEILSRKLWNYD